MTRRTRTVTLIVAAAVVGSSVCGIVIHLFQDRPLTMALAWSLSAGVAWALAAKLAPRIL